MSVYLTSDTELTAIANAIRTRTGTTATLNYPTDFIAGINAISGDGGSGSGGSGAGGITVDTTNLFIVCQNNQPNNPQENTIWVKTSQYTNNYTFRYQAPTDNLTDGMLWFGTGWWTDNEISINGVYFQLTCCHQYINSEWVEKDAYIYQNSSWKIFSDLYHPLNNCNFAQSYKNLNNNPLVNGNSGTVSANGWGVGGTGVRWVGITVPFHINSSKTTCYVRAVRGGNLASTGGAVRFGFTSTATSTSWKAVQSANNGTSELYTPVDLTGLTEGDYYFRCYCNGYEDNGQIYTATVTMKDISIE